MKIVIAGNYGAKNLGDEMILEGLLESLKSIVPNAKITVLSADPEETKQKYKIDSFVKFPAGIRSLFSYLRSSDNPTKKTVQECDYFILGGGGLFGSLSFHANIIWLIQTYMAYKAEKPVIMYGQSIGPIKWPLIRNLVKKIFQKSKFIAVRDNDSKIELEKLGIKNGIHVMADLAFSDRFAITIKKPNLSPYAVISLRKTSSITQNFQNTIINFLNWLINDQNYDLKFIDFQEGREGDYKIHKSISAQLKNSNKIEHINNVSDSNQILEVIAQADFLFGMRLHSIISATKTCTPFIAINYAPKVEAFTKSIPLSEYLINLEEFNLEKVKNLFDKIQENKQQIQKFLKEFSIRAYSKTLEMEQLLKRIFQHVPIGNKP